jgi:hypothetical protein
MKTIFIGKVVCIVVSIPIPKSGMELQIWAELI